MLIIFVYHLKQLNVNLSDICLLFYMLCSDIVISLIGSVCLTLTLLSAILKKSNRLKPVLIMSESSSVSLQNVLMLLICLL